jgi:tetratricopeptide (TPR) repeat protein
VAKPERNAPCLCGSGSKYKKCCLAKDEAQAMAKIRSQREVEAATTRERAAFQARYWAANELVAARDRWELVEDGLDDLSNSVINLIDERRFDDALKACEQLLQDFPDVVDGLDRYAAVYEAMGNLMQARDYYQRALEFTNLPEQQSGFDDEGREWRGEKISEIEARSGFSQHRLQVDVPGNLASETQ